MTTKPAPKAKPAGKAPPKVEIRNPRYKGATPQMVAHAVAYHQPKGDKR